jgi:SagB-type dehydrogenase family enzyme
MYVQLRTRDEKPILESQDLLALDDRSRRLLFALKDTVARVDLRPQSFEQLSNACKDDHGDIGAVALHAVLGILAEQGLLVVTARAEAPRIMVVPYTQTTFERLLTPVAPARHRLSRFALLRPGDGGKGCRLECPLAHAHVEVSDAELAATAGGYLGCREVEILPADAPGDPETALLCLALAVCGFGTSDTATDTQENELPYWDFHELYFHSRSRLGRRRDPVGATFKMARRFPPEPAVKPSMPVIERIALRVPDYSQVVAGDLTLTAALETRKSIRSHGGMPLSIDQLSEFLYRTAAVRSSWVTQIGEFTRRPYPAGGASYDIEFYLLISRVAELQPGLYHYDPLGHALEFLSRETELHREMLWDAFRACAQTTYPDILFVLTSRFKRLSWKYSGMVYATVLKHVGVVYATMYLVATAMRLAPCALGLGNSDHFARLSGVDYYDEGAVGEFMLGRPG